MASVTTYLKVPKSKPKPSSRPLPPSQRPVLQILQCLLAFACSVSFVPDHAQLIGRPVIPGAGVSLPETSLLSVQLVIPNLIAQRDDRLMIAQDPCGFVVYQLPAAPYRVDKALPFTLLILAGDIETNPGPAKKGKSGATVSAAPQLLTALPASNPLRGTQTYPRYSVTDVTNGCTLPAFLA